MYEVLRPLVPENRLFTNENMAKHTSFRIGGIAKIYIQPENTSELRAVIASCRANSVEYILLGGGTNVLFSDDGFDGVVIQTQPGCSHLTVEGKRIIAGAGLSLAALAQAACKAGLDGLPFASGIPGTVGGGVFMNAGAYNHNIAEVFEYAELLTPGGEVVCLRASEMVFGYRHSVLRENGCILLSAAFRLAAGDTESIRAEMKSLNARRAKSQPLEYPSAGSVFKRPEGYFAGKLISDAGLKKYSVGGAEVSEKHAGFIINTGGAAAADVKALINHIQKTVYTLYGVMLEPEIREVP